MEGGHVASHLPDVFMVSQADLAGREESGVLSASGRGQECWRHSTTFCTRGKKQENGVDSRVSQTWVRVCLGWVNYWTFLHITILFCKIWIIAHALWVGEVWKALNTELAQNKDLINEWDTGQRRTDSTWGQRIPDEVYRKWEN